MSSQVLIDENWKEIEILTLPKLKGRLYYYGGNFFYPLAALDQNPGSIIKAIREFSKTNSELIKSDRSSKYYKSLEQLVED